MSQKRNQEQKSKSGFPIEHKPCKTEDCRKESNHRNQRKTKKEPKDNVSDSIRHAFGFF